MSYNYNHNYNLNRLSQDEQVKRYGIINRFVEYNSYFAYLPALTNPTNNYMKYSDATLETIILELTYGNIEGESVLPEVKKAYQEFVKDYTYSFQIYAREEQEKQRIVQEQQMAALQHNTNTQPVAFYGGQNPQYQPQQGYGGQYDPNYANRQSQQPYYPQQQPRERRYNNNREQGQYGQPREQREHQNREQPRHQQYREVQPQGEYTHGQKNREYGHPNSRERKFHEKRSQDPYQQQYQQYQPYQQVQPYPHYSHPQHQDHEDHHLWHKYSTKSGDIMIFESHNEYEEFLHFKQKYGIQIEVKFDPQDKFHPKPEQLIEEAIAAPQAIPEPVPEPVVVPQPVPEPVVVPSPQSKPRRFTIEEIKQFINSVSKEELEKHVNPEVVAKAAEVRGWASQEVEVEQKEDKRKQHDNKKPQGGDNKGRDRDIKTGVKRDQSKVAESLGYKPQQSPVVQITIGKNETLETRKIKEDIRNMAGKDFATLKEKEFDTMDNVEKCRKEIIYNLNLIVPQNLGLIEKDIIHHLFEDAGVLRTLIEEIIKKAWDQPKYASTYAKLCSDFCKRQPSEFKFEGAKKEGKKEEPKQGRREKRDNPFKYFLIERVQHSFDQKIEKFPDFESPEDKEIFLKEKKKNILSNVKFIAELIIHKVLKKRTIKYCISQLFESFLRHFHSFKHEDRIEDSIYDYHFEGIIQFIENIGEFYEELGQKEKEVQQYDFAAIRGHIGQVLSLKAAPKPATLDQIEYFNGDEYFKLLAFINDTLIRQNFPRLSALLQNLVERRNNKWAKHLSSSEGPKTLKEIQEDILREEDDTQGKGKEKMSKEKMEQEKLDKKVKELFEGWEMTKGEQLREIKEILRKTNERTFYFSLLKQVADEKKENIIKRVALFAVLLNERFIFTDFRQAWFDIIKYLAQGSGDYPFCGAALAQILQLLLEKEGTLGDMWRAYNNDEEEDEGYFIQEIFQKYYHYSKDETALKWVKPKPKLSGLI